MDRSTAIGAFSTLKFLPKSYLVRIMEELETRRITSKGQITIPLALRETLGFSVGDRISFVKTDDGDVLLRKSALPETLFGLMDKFLRPEKIGFAW